MQQATQRPSSPSEQNSYQPQHTPNLKDKAETLHPHPQHKPSVNKETAVQQLAPDKMTSRHIPRLRAVVESQAFKNILVDEMDMMLSRAATLIQASWRGYQLRQKLTSQMMAAKSIQEAWRRFNTRRLLRSGRAVGKKVHKEEGDIPYHPPQQVRFQPPEEGKSLQAQPVMVSKETQCPSTDTLATCTPQVTSPQPQGTPQLGMQAPGAVGGSAVTFLPHQTTAIRPPGPEAKCLLTRTVRNACLAHHVEGDMVKTKQITTKANKPGASGPPPSGKHVQAVHGMLKNHVGAEVKTLPHKDPAPVITKTPAQSNPVPRHTQTYPVTKTPSSSSPGSTITTKTSPRPYPTTLVAKALPQTGPASTVTKSSFQSCLPATTTKSPPQTGPPATVTKTPPQMGPPAAMTKTPLQSCLAAMMNRIPTLPCPVSEMTITKTSFHTYPPPTMAKVPLQPCPVAPVTKTPAQIQPTSSMTNTLAQTRSAAMVTKFPPQICLLASMIKPPPQTCPTAATAKAPPQTCPVTGTAKTPAQTRLATTSAKTTMQTGRITITKTPPQMPPGPLLTKTAPQARLAAMITKTPAQLRSVATILRTLCLPPPAGGNLKTPPAAAGGIPNTPSHTCLNGSKVKSMVIAKEVAGVTKISSHLGLTEGTVKHCSSPQMGAGTSKTPARSPVEVGKNKVLPQKQVKTVSSTSVVMRTLPGGLSKGKVTEGKKSPSQVLLRTDVVKVQSQSQVFAPVETAVIPPQGPMTKCPAKTQPHAQLATCPTTNFPQRHPLAELTKVLSQGHPPTKLATSLSQSPLGACLSKAQSQGHMPPKLAKAPSLAHLGKCLTKAQSQAHLVTGMMKVHSQAHLPIGLTRAQSQAQLVTETAKCLYTAQQATEKSSKTTSQPLLAGLKASTQLCQTTGTLGSLPQAKLDNRPAQLSGHSHMQTKATQGPCQRAPEAQSMLVPLLASPGHATCKVESWGDSRTVQAQSSTVSPATSCQEELAASQLASLCAELAAVLGSHEDLRSLLTKALSQGEVRTALNQALSKEVLTTTVTKALPQGMLGMALVKALSWGELGIALSRALSRGELRAELTKAMQGKLTDVLSKALTEEERAALSQALCQGELGAVLGQSLSQAALRTGVVLPKATSKPGSGMTVMPTPVAVDYSGGSQSAPWGPTLCPVRPQPSKVRVPQDGAWEGCIQGWPTGLLAEMGDGVMLLGSSCWSVVSVCASSLGKVITTVHQCPLMATLGPTLSWETRSHNDSSSNLFLNPEVHEKNVYLPLGVSKLARDSGPKLPTSPHPQPPPSLWQPLSANGVGPSTSQPSVAGSQGPRSHKPHMVSRVAPHLWLSSGASSGAPDKLPGTSGSGRSAHSHRCAAGSGGTCWCRSSSVCQTSGVRGPQQPPVVPHGTMQTTPSHNRAGVGSREIHNKVTPSPPLATKARKMPLTQTQTTACDRSPSVPVSTASDHPCALKNQMDPSLFQGSAGSRLAPTHSWAALPRQGKTRTRAPAPDAKCPQDHTTGHCLRELVVSLPQGSDSNLTRSFSQGSKAHGPRVSDCPSSVWSCSSLSPSATSAAGLTEAGQVEDRSQEASLDRNLQLESLLTSEALGRVQGPREVEVAERGGHRPMIPTFHHQSSPASEMTPILTHNSVSSRVTFSVHWGLADQDGINIGSDQCPVGRNKSFPQGSCNTGLTRSLSVGNLVPAIHQHCSVANRLTTSLYQPVTGKVGPTLDQPYMAMKVTPSLSDPSISIKRIPSLGQSSKASRVALSLRQGSGISAMPPSGTHTTSSIEVGSGPFQSCVTSGMNPTLAQPPKLSESAPFLSQSSVISELTPSSAQPSVTGGVAPSLTQAPVSGGAASSLAQPSVTSEVVPCLAQLSVTGGVAPSLTQPPVSGGVASSLAQPSVTDGVPCLAQLSVTGGVAPCLAHAPVSGGVASPLTQPSVSDGVPCLAQLSVTGGVAPILAQPPKINGLASSLAHPTVASGAVPSLAQPSMISTVTPNLVQPSVTGEMPPSQAQPFLTIGMVPHLVQPSMTDGVTLSLTLPSMTGSVAPSLGHPPMVCGVIPGLVQPSVTSRVSPSLVQSPMTSEVAPSLGYPAMVCGVTHSLAKPLVASRGSSRLVHPSVTDKLTSRISQPSAVRGKGRALRQPRAAPQVGSNLSSSVSSVTWRQHRPSFLLEVSSSRPYPRETRSMTQGLSQPSVSAGVDTCKGPLMVSGVTSNPQGPEFSELSLAFYQPLDVGKNASATEHSAVTVSVPSLYQASAARGKESCLGQEAGVSQGLLFRSLAASMSHGVTTAGILPNMSQGTLMAGMTRNVYQRNVMTGMGPSQVAGAMAPNTPPAGARLTPEQVSEMSPRFPWASVPGGISLSPSSFPLAGVCPSMPQVSGALPVHVDQQHSPMSTTVTANYEHSNAVSEEPVLGKASDLVLGSAASKMTLATDPGTMASGMAPSLSPGSVASDVGKSVPPGSGINGVALCLPPDYVVNSEAQTLPPGCAIHGTVQCTCVVSGRGQGLPPGSVVCDIDQGLPPGSVVSGVTEILYPGAAVSGMARTLPSAPVVSGLSQSVPSNSVASTTLPAVMTGRLNQHLGLGPMAPASRGGNQSLPQGSMLVGITPPPYLGALAGEGTATPFRASPNTYLGQVHPQALEASGPAKDMSQLSVALQRAEQWSQMVGLMPPLETTDGQTMVKPGDQEAGLSQANESSVGPDKPVILEGTPWMYPNPMVTDLDSSPEFLTKDGTLPIGHRPLLEEVAPRQARSMASGLASGPPQHLRFVKNPVPGNVTLTLQQKSATTCGVPSSHSVAFSRIPSVQGVSVKDTGDPLAHQQAPGHPVISQSPSAHQQAPVVPMMSQSPSGHQQVWVSPVTSMAPMAPHSPSAHQQVPVAPVAHQSPSVLRQVSVAHIGPWNPSHGMVDSTVVSGSSKLTRGSSVAPRMYPKSVARLRASSPSQRLGTTNLASHRLPHASTSSKAALGELWSEAVPSAPQKPVSGVLAPRSCESVRPRKSYRSTHSGLVPEMLDGSVARIVPSHRVQEHAPRFPLVGSRSSTGAPPGFMPIIRTEQSARGPATSKPRGGARKVSLGYASTPDGTRRPLSRQESLLGSLDHPTTSLTPAVLQGPADAGMAGGQAWNSTVPTVAVGPMSGTVAPGGAWEPARGIVPWGTTGGKAAEDPRQSDQLVASVQAVEKIITQAVITIQACARGYLVRRTIRVWHQWAIIIQAAWRGYCVRRDLIRLIRAATIIQAAWRGFYFRRNQAQMLLPSMWPEAVTGARTTSDHRCFQSCQPHVCALCQSLSSGLGSPPSVVMLVGSSPRTCHMCGHTLPTRVVHGMGQGGSGQAWGYSSHRLILRTSQHPHCRNKAAIIIQAAWRGFLVRQKLRQQQLAAKMLQATWRGHHTRSSLSTDALLGSATWGNPRHMQWPGV